MKALDLVLVHQRVVRRDAGLAGIGKLPKRDAGRRMVERMALRRR